MQRALDERGPMALAELLRIAGVSRSAVERLDGAAICRCGTSPWSRGVSLFDAEFSAPSKHSEWRTAAGSVQICDWLDAGVFTAGLMYGVDRQGGRRKCTCARWRRRSNAGRTGASCWCRRLR